MPIVTLTTDFGLEDYYVAMLKGTLLQHNPALNIIDVSHAIKPYDIVQAAFVLKNSYSSFPKGTLHIITVNNNPGVSSFITFQLFDHYFMGPDNGVFTLMFDQLPEQTFRLEIDNDKPFPLKKMLSKAVADFYSGRPFSEIAPPAGEIVRRIALQPVISTSQIRGSVIYVDHYENAIVNIHRELFNRVRNGRDFALFFKRHDPITRLCSHYGEASVGETLCLFNAASFLEIAINMGKASSMLGLYQDDMVQIDFYSPLSAE